MINKDKVDGLVSAVNSILLNSGINRRLSISDRRGYLEVILSFADAEERVSEDKSDNKTGNRVMDRNSVLFTGDLTSCYLFLSGVESAVTMLYTCKN